MKSKNLVRGVENGFERNFAWLFYMGEESSHTVLEILPVAGFELFKYYEK